MSHVKRTVIFLPLKKTFVVNAYQEFPFDLHNYYKQEKKSHNCMSDIVGFSKGMQKL